MDRATFELGTGAAVDSIRIYAQLYCIANVEEGVSNDMDILNLLVEAQVFVWRTQVE